ncbi:hypothetical protein LCGC14_1277510, partial [marine sediment metagenome]
GNIEIGQVGDHVGIELDDGTLQWTFIGGALSTTLTLIDALTDDVAVDNHVYSYKIKVPRPISVVETRLHRADGQDVPIVLTGRLDYELLSLKTTEATPNQVYYDKQLINADLLVWPVPIDMQEYLKFTARLPIQDIINLTDGFDIAQEFFLAIAWNLAPLIAPKHEKPVDLEMALIAKNMLEEALAGDSEDASVFFQVGGYGNYIDHGRYPNTRGGYGR